jgi:hypothetical protein
MENSCVFSNQINPTKLKKKNPWKLKGGVKFQKWCFAKCNLFSHILNTLPLFYAPFAFRSTERENSIFHLYTLVRGMFLKQFMLE